MEARQKKWLAWAVGLGLAVYFGPTIYDRLRYGAASGPSAGKSYIKIKPADLAAAAGVPVDVYSLGRAIRSEAGRRSEPERTAVAWAVKNESRGRGITATVTTGKVGAGYYGAQNLGGRYVSTAEAPRAADLELAGNVIGGKVRDNTGGATRFFAPTLQDRLFSLGRKGYTKDAAAVVARWRKDGYSERAIPGVPAREFVVFVKAKPVAAPKDDAQGIAGVSERNFGAFVKVGRKAAA